jgi:AraC-like DNA-binding protein
MPVNLSALKDLALAYNGHQAHQMPQLSAFQSETLGKIEGSIYEPALCLILQGAKAVSIGEYTVPVNAGEALIVSHTLPVISQIIKASREEPYCAFVLFLDLPMIYDLHDQLGEPRLSKADARSLSAGTPEESWLEPFIRYVELAASPRDAQILGPSILREIHYRLLLSETGKALRGLLGTDSHSNRIAKAIHQLRSNYRAPLRVPDLARIAGMSAASFHEYFKAITGTTPLQYQKDLRLIEANNLLAAANFGVSDAAFSVGYESPNHFSRDYRRKFGMPPSLRLA